VHFVAAFLKSTFRASIPEYETDSYCRSTYAWTYNSA